MRSRLAAAIAGAALGAALALPAAAWAVEDPYPPPDEGAGEVSPSRVRAGECVTFSGNGFATGAAVAVTDDGAARGSAPADGTGRFTSQVCFTTAARVGRHELQGQGSKRNASGATRTVTAYVTVTGVEQTDPDPTASPTPSRTFEAGGPTPEPTASPTGSSGPTSDPSTSPSPGPGGGNPGGGNPGGPGGGNPGGPGGGNPGGPNPGNPGGPGGPGDGNPGGPGGPGGGNPGGPAGGNPDDGEPSEDVPSETPAPPDGEADGTDEGTGLGEVLPGGPAAPRGGDGGSGVARLLVAGAVVATLAAGTGGLLLLEARRARIPGAPA